MATHIYTPIYSGPIRKHPIYKTWDCIKSRCFNQKHTSYKRYGATGITLYPEWKESSAAFLEWIDNNLGKRPDGFSLDRIDPHGNYEPDNLRWASLSTQSKNIRNPEEKARKISESNIGDNNCSKRHEVRQKLSDAAKKRQKKTCPHCGKELQPQHYARWHGERCPMNPERN